MSLVRLLTSGKSLVGLQDVESRYRMRRENLLPRFGSSKNPFMARPETAHPPVMAGATAQPQPPLGEPSPAEKAAARMKQTRRLPMAAPAGEVRKTSLTERSAGVLRRITRLARNLNPLSWRPGRRPAPAQAKPGSNGSPVQAELSLDRIKVVRNDLYDADVEIVPAKSPANTKPGPARHVQDAAGLAAAQPG